MADAQAQDAPKKNSPVMIVAALAIVTLLAGGGGWMIGGMIAPKVEEIKAVQAAVEEGKKKEGKVVAKIPAAPNGIVQLEPITTNLAYPSTSWVRLEVALMFKGPIEVPLAEDIHQDILAYLRTVSLQQIEGPRGFQYLRDDLQERVDLRSQGRVLKVMFRSFVIE